MTLREEVVKLEAQKTLTPTEQLCLNFLKSEGILEQFGDKTLVDLETENKFTREFVKYNDTQRTNLRDS